MTPASKPIKRNKTPRARKTVRASEAVRGFAEDKAKWTWPPAAAAPQTGIARIFMNGRSQAVRLPKEFRLPGDKVRVRREGDRIVLEPMKRNWDEVLAEIHRLTRGEFPERDQPPMPPDDDLDPFD